MCGIAGFKFDKRVNAQVIKQMVEALHHRGPDMDGFFNNGPYQAGMRRLMINDFDTGGQPLFNYAKDVVVFYNGEIYNSPQLRLELQKKGYQFRTTCDGEVICHLYEEYGELLFEYLDGMFAVALWDVKEQRLILGRDIPGEKPLYYSSLSETEIAFASEIKSLRYFPQVSRELDCQSIWDFPTFLWIPEPNTIYRDVKALMPGHYLVVDKLGTRISKYENRFKVILDGQSDQEIIKQIRTVVEDSIKSRLLSDVPLGSFLSGGLDSSIVATIARRNLDRLDTFTIGFEDVDDPYHGRADESQDAREYAKVLGTNHHEIRVTGQTFQDALDTFCEFGDQPFAVSSGLGLLTIAKAAREAGIKVLLSGDGADEVFGGYSWYEYLPLEAAANVSDGDVSSQNHGMSLKDRLQNLSQYKAHKRAWAWHYYASEAEKQKLFSSNIYDSSDTSLRFFTKYNGSDQWDAEDYIRQDRQFYLPNEMLKKMDRMTMAYSVEGRAPFVAPSVLSLADQLKYTQLIKDGSLKWMLRAAFADILPQGVLSRPKHGFNVPIDHWLKSDWKPLVDQTFSADSMLVQKGIINRQSVDVAHTMIADPDRLNGHSIFCFIMLNKWLERNG